MLCLEGVRDPIAAASFREAVFELLFRAPLFGLMTLGTAIRVYEMPLGHACTTMCTDGRSIWYHPEWVLKKPRVSIAFDVLHEGLHVFNNHPARRGARDWDAWAFAIDVRVAHDALKIFRAKDPDYNLDTDHIPALLWAERMTAEQIYDEVKKDPAKKPSDFVPDILPPPPATPAEDAHFKQKLTQDLAQATIAEEQRHKTPIKARYGDHVWERLQEMRRCSVPWDTLLQGRLCGQLGHDLASWVPMNRRFLPLIALPSHRSRQEDELILGIDVSYSIDEELVGRFKACVLPAARRAKKTTVITFDERIREVHTSTRPEALLRDLRFMTGSHSYTSTVGLFEEVKKRRPSAVAILTDGYVMLPEAPFLTTHWVLTPSGVPLPWGINYKMHASW